MGRLHALHTEYDQSPWLDNLKRGYLTSGELQRWVDRGVRGITSNPTIFQKAISAGTDYDDEFRSLIDAGDSVTDSYWELVTHDIEAALAILRPSTTRATASTGSCPSRSRRRRRSTPRPPSPRPATCTRRSAQPNLYVKIPGTGPGLPAIQQMITEGRSINVTLLFSLERYGEVIEAYLAGLEAAPAGVDLSPGGVGGLVLREPGRHRGRPPARGHRHAEALALRGKAAVANAQLAYQLFLERFSRPPLGRPGRPGRPGAAAAVGVDVDEEPGLPRHALRRQPHRPAHGQHHARRHARGVRRPRPAGPHARRRPRRRPRRDRRLAEVGRRPRRRHPAARGRGRGLVLEVLRRAARARSTPKPRPSRPDTHARCTVWTSGPRKRPQVGAACTDPSSSSTTSPVSSPSA